MSTVGKISALVSVMALSAVVLFREGSHVLHNNFSKPFGPSPSFHTFLGTLSLFFLSVCVCDT